jgi:hypothetical protein
MGIRGRRSQRLLFPFFCFVQHVYVRTTSYYSTNAQVGFGLRMSFGGTLVSVLRVTLELSLDLTSCHDIDLHIHNHSAPSIPPFFPSFVPYSPRLIPITRKSPDQIVVDNLRLVMADKEGGAVLGFVHTQTHQQNGPRATEYSTSLVIVQSE